MGRKVMFARISDNVLDEVDWPVARLVLRDGVVVEQAQHKPGAYAFGQLVGITSTMLAAWSRFDATGTHPEMYHELAEAAIDYADRTEVPGEFRTFWTAEEVAS